MLSKAGIKLGSKMLSKRIGSGMVLGKFYPLTEGHGHLLHFARMSCHRLTILVCTLKSDSIPGEIRYQWVKAMFPDANVVHHYADIQQEPNDDPDGDPEFWKIWMDTIAKHCPGEEFDAVFGSEDYGWQLADELGCEYIPVNRIRNQVPISGTKMREDPMKYWEYLPNVVRPYFARRIAVLGPESVGKSFLARNLAKHFDTAFTDEYGRRYLEDKIRTAGYALDEFRFEDIPNIARGQMVSEDSMAYRAKKLLICDTDPLTTSVWSNTFFGECPNWITLEAKRRKYDLTILLSPDGAPHIQDGTRTMTDEKVRHKFFEEIQSALEKAGRPYQVVSGNWQERFEQSIKLVQAVLERKLFI